MRRSKTTGTDCILWPLPAFGWAPVTSVFSCHVEVKVTAFLFAQSQAIDEEKEREILEERERAAKSLLEITGWFKCSWSIVTRKTLFTLATFVAQVLVGPRKNENKSQLARSKPACYLQAWPRIWTRGYRETSSGSDQSGTRTRAPLDCESDTLTTRSRCFPSDDVTIIWDFPQTET